MSASWKNPALKVDVAKAGAAVARALTPKTTPRSQYTPMAGVVYRANHAETARAKSSSPARQPPSPGFSLWELARGATCPLSPQSFAEQQKVNRFQEQTHLPVALARAATRRSRAAKGHNGMQKRPTPRPEEYVNYIRKLLAGSVVGIGSEPMVNMIQYTLCAAVMHDLFYKPELDKPTEDEKRWNREHRRSLRDEALNALSDARLVSCARWDL
jgi:hypothetical protein